MCGGVSKVLEEEDNQLKTFTTLFLEPPQLLTEVFPKRLDLYNIVMLCLLIRTIFIGQDRHFKNPFCFLDSKLFFIGICSKITSIFFFVLEKEPPLQSAINHHIFGELLFLK